MSHVSSASVSRVASIFHVSTHLRHAIPPNFFPKSNTKFLLHQRSCHAGPSGQNPLRTQQQQGSFIKGPGYDKWHTMMPATSSDLLELVAQTTRDIIQDAKFDRSLLAMWVQSLNRSLYYISLSTPLAAFSRFLSQPPAGMSRPFRPTRFAQILQTIRDDVARVRNHTIPIPWDLSIRYLRPSLTASVSSAVDLTMLVREVTTMGMRMWQESRRAEAENTIGDYTRTPIWMDGSIYPDYYKRPFHYQSDGWMSSRSAAAYNMLTELLFDGCQDPMQRLAVAEVYARFRSHDRPIIVELAAGTGKVATHVRHFLPRAQLTVTDLSPFFLERARDMMLRRDQAVRIVDQLRSVDTKFVQANAACLPMRDQSIDCVYTVYLLHELPADARRAVFKEAARVLKTGGVFVIADAAQNGDRQAWGAGGKSFTRFGEPWFTSYYDDCIQRLGLEEGLYNPGVVDLCSFTKMVSFIRT